MEGGSERRGWEGGRKCGRRVRGSRRLRVKQAGSVGLKVGWESDMDFPVMRLMDGNVREAGWESWCSALDF